VTVDLFSYGTLRQAEVQQATFGRLLAGTEDAIAGYELGELTITDPDVIPASGSATHPRLVAASDPDAQVAGIVFTISEDDLAAADAYEVRDYIRIQVPLRSGRLAWVYVFDADGAEAAAATSLLDAQDSALELLAETQRRHLVAAGVTERAASDAIRDLAASMFGVTRHWHKRIVRAGPNTLLPYEENPPDRLIAADDIAFLDFGPIFADWEADVGRTLVLGDDPRKRQLAAALPVIWQAGREYFDRHPRVTGEELYEHIVTLAQRDGWEFAGQIAGHLVGEFPHKQISGNEIESYIAPGNSLPMRRRDRAGRACHWILEVHIADRALQIGGFHEQLLDLTRA
jgi:gamma-glutamylcyclotransferase (GGCT)/AIG2-like uncharacterized protein YtfP